MVTPSRNSDAVRLERVLAPNPGPYTGPGTNTYVVEFDGLSAVIDPGPVIATHLSAIERALGDSQAVAVLVTHTHPDHAPAANPLARRLAVPALGFAPGPAFDPTELLSDGEEVAVGGGRIRVVHTPGHTPDHVCFLTQGVLFTGDHIMGGSTVIIEDAADYMESLRRVLHLQPAHICPGHGPEIDDATGMIEAYIAHREERERQVLEAVTAGADTVGAIVEVVYPDLDATLVPAAVFQVETQLKKLSADGLLEFRPGGAMGRAIRRPHSE
jgi:glyoxylase-like metal-dependent hydrolase (beta-lactamase superfamily II)